MGARPPAVPLALRICLLVALALGALVTVASPAAPAAGTAGTGRNVGRDRPAVDVIEVEGLIDPVSERFIRRALAAARAQRTQVLLIQLDSPGSLLDPARLAALERDLAAAADLVVAVWVGQAGARAEGGAMRLVRAADIVGLAPGATIGRAAPNPDGTPDPLAARTLDPAAALAEGIAQLSVQEASVLTAFIGSLDGRTVAGRTLDTAEDDAVRNDSTGELERQLLPVRFAKLGIVDQLVHVTTSPTIAYALGLIALCLIVFECFTGGVGVAAGVAVLAGGLSIHGLGLLPTRPLGVVLVLAAFVAFAVDAQTTMPRVWTGIGTALLVAGSLTLFHTADGRQFRLPWWVVALMSVATVVFMVTAVPTATRARFSSPVVDRGPLVGATGTVEAPLEPEGAVRIDGAPWPARVRTDTGAGSAAVLATGTPVRVVDVDGYRLVVQAAAGDTA